MKEANRTNATQGNYCSYMEVNNIPFMLDPNFEAIYEQGILAICGCILLVTSFIVIARCAKSFGHMALMTVSTAMKVYQSRKSFLFFDESGILDFDQVRLRRSLNFPYGLFWIMTIFVLKKEHILRKCGPNAYNYVLFQGYVLCFTTLLMVVGMFAVLPMHLLGDVLEPNMTYSRTTVNNVRLDKKAIAWFHFTLSVSLFPIAQMLVQLFNKNMRQGFVHETNKKILLFVGSHKQHENLEEDLRRVLREISPNVRLVQTKRFFGNKVISASKAMQKASLARAWCETREAETGKEVRIKPIIFGRYSTWSLCCCKKNAVEFYRKEEGKYIDKLHNYELEGVTPNEGVLYSFRNAKEALYVYNHFYRSPWSLRQFLSPHMRVYPVPHLEDLIAENVNSNYYWWYFKFAILNFGVLCLFFFLSTPTILLLSLKKPLQFMVGTFTQMTEEKSIMTALIPKLLPSLVLIIITAVLPFVVYLCERMQGYWSLSTMNTFMMLKVYIYLLFMVWVLPTVGRTALKDSLEHLTTHSYGNFTCPPKKNVGALYVKYIINMAFLSAPAQLLRIPDYLMYFWLIVLSRHAAEKPFIVNENKYCFEYGLNYSWYLVTHTIMVVYCWVSPLVTLAGFVCQVIFHFVDRYNIYFSDIQSLGSQHIHLIACHFFLLGPILNQMCLITFLVFKDGDVTIVTVLSIYTALCLLCFIKYLFCATLFRKREVEESDDSSEDES